VCGNKKRSCSPERSYIVSGEKKIMTSKKKGRKRWRSRGERRKGDFLYRAKKRGSEGIRQFLVERKGMSVSSSPKGGERTAQDCVLDRAEGKGGEG